MKVRVVISFDFSDKHRESLATHGWWAGVKEKDGIVRVTREELQDCLRSYGDPNTANNSYDDLFMSIPTKGGGLNEYKNTGVYTV